MSTELSWIIPQTSLLLKTDFFLGAEGDQLIENYFPSSMYSCYSFFQDSSPILQQSSKGICMLVNFKVVFLSFSYYDALSVVKTLIQYNYEIFEIYGWWRVLLPPDFTLPFSWSWVWRKCPLQLNALCHSFGLPIPKSMTLKSHPWVRRRKWLTNGQNG